MKIVIDQEENKKVKRVIHQEEDKKVTIVRPTGRINLACAFDLRKVLTKEAKQGWTLIVDLKEVIFMDSSGLGALISGFKAAKKVGGEFCLMRPNEQVSYLLSISALNRVLPVYDSPEKALSGIK